MRINCKGGIEVCQRLSHGSSSTGPRTLFACLLEVAELPVLLTPALKDGGLAYQNLRLCAL